MQRVICVSAVFICCLSTGARVTNIGVQFFSQWLWRIDIFIFFHFITMAPLSLHFRKLFSTKDTMSLICKGTCNLLLTFQHFRAYGIKVARELNCYQICFAYAVELDTVVYNLLIFGSKIQTGPFKSKPSKNSFGLNVKGLDFRSFLTQFLTILFKFQNCWDQILDRKRFGTVQEPKINKYAWEAAITVTILSIK